MQLSSIVQGFSMIPPLKRQKRSMFAMNRALPNTEHKQAQAITAVGGWVIDAGPGNRIPKYCI